MSLLLSQVGVQAVAGFQEGKMTFMCCKGLSVPQSPSALQWVGGGGGDLSSCLVYLGRAQCFNAKISGKGLEPHKPGTSYSADLNSIEGLHWVGP